jgi:streptogramin lyase
MRLASRLAVFLLTVATLVAASSQTEATLVGTGVGGYGDTQVNNPYGLVIGPDGALYFCDLDNQRIRRLDLTTKRLTTIAGNGEKG